MATFTEKDARKYRRSLDALVKEVQKAVRYLDLVGKGTQDDKTGKAIAIVCNTLEFAADYHRHFTLGQALKPKRSER